MALLGAFAGRALLIGAGCVVLLAGPRLRGGGFALVGLGALLLIVALISVADYNR